MIEKATGKVVSVTSFASSPTVTVDGTQDEHYLYRTVSSNQVVSKFYNFTTELFEDYPPKPNSDFYDWVLTEWVFNQTEFLAAVRRERNRKLAETDWTQMADVSLTSEEQTEIVNYRTALRDVPSNLTGSERSLDDVQWP